MIPSDEGLTLETPPPPKMFMTCTMLLHSRKREYQHITWLNVARANYSLWRRANARDHPSKMFMTCTMLLHSRKREYQHITWLNVARANDSLWRRANTRDHPSKMFITCTMLLHSRTWAQKLELSTKTTTWLNFVRANWQRPRARNHPSKMFMTCTMSCTERENSSSALSQENNLRELQAICSGERLTSLWWGWQEKFEIDRNIRSAFQYLHFRVERLQHVRPDVIEALLEQREQHVPLLSRATLQPALCHTRINES